mmetsp:Transcript_637/g.666  ORF Transcript_637/g.666 Transcript_637/m.666 type:complete len:733 (+) Transcript_637:93-2291(+)
MLRIAEHVAGSQQRPDGSKSSSLYNAGKYDIYWLGITIVIGGQLIYWNQSLAEGFWPFCVSTIIVGTGYVCLTLCLAEMTSFLPFAGGSWGYARCALGPIPGFLVGVCETIEYVLYVTSAVLELGNLISLILGTSPAYEPLYWLLFFVISLFIQIYSPHVFWRFNMIIGAISFILILLYFFASIPAFNFYENLGSDWSDGFIVENGVPNFLYYFPLASWFYVGVEVMTLSCSEVKDAGNFVPQAMFACMITLLITSFIILFGSSLQSPGPGSLATEVLPLNPGYQYAFQISSQICTVLAIPGTFATAFGFMFAYGRQIYSMSTSGLFPHFLSQTYGEHKAPITALFLGSTLAYGTLLFLWYLYPNFARQLFNLCMLGSCSVYIALFRSYLVCKQRYSNLDRKFNNRLSSFSAMYGMLVFSFMWVALAFFQRDNYVSLAVFVCFIIIFLFYYFLVVQKREFFSDEEQANFMKAYILNASEKRRHGKHHRPDGVLGRLYVITMIPIRWITRKAVTSSSSSAKKSPGVVDDQNLSNKRSSYWWLSLFSGSSSSKKGRKLNNMSSVGKVKPYPIPVTTSKTEDSNHKGGSNAPTVSSSSSSAPHYNLAGKVHRSSSNFSRSLNHLEESLDAISSSEKIPEKALERNNSFQTVTTATANTSMIDNGSVQYNQSVSIAMESSIDSDWMPSSSTRRHQHNHHLNNNNQYSPSSRQRSLFFTVNGNLVQLHETVTTISHC